MKRYRILTNGERFRVQRRYRMGPVDFWRDERYFEVNESYPKVIQHPVEFERLEEAEGFVRKRMDAEEASRRRRWWVVRKYSDAPEPSVTVPAGDHRRS